MIIDPTPITKMTDMDACRSLRDGIRPLLKDLRDPTDGWIKRHRWTVIPQLDFGHQEQAEWTVTAAHRLGHDECVAVNTSYPLDCYLVPMTPLAIVHFGFDIELEDYVLVPKDLGFAIYRVDGDSALVAGPRSFVRRVVGGSLATARRMVAEHFSVDDGRLLVLDAYGRWLHVNWEPVDDDDIAVEPVFEPGSVAPIEDRTEASDLYDKARPVVAGAGHFSRKYVQDNNWLVVPRAQPLDLMDAASLTGAAIQYGHKALFAVPWSESAKSIAAYRIPMNRDAILEFAEMRAKKHSVVFPTDLSFAILIADEWYYLVGGPEDFVRKAFNRPISDAREDFEDDYELHSDYFLDDYESTREWPQAHVRRRMHAIAERYKVFDRE